MRENEPVLLVLSVCDGEIILEKGEILSEKRHIVSPSRERIQGHLVTAVPHIRWRGHGLLAAAKQPSRNVDGALHQSACGTSRGGLFHVPTLSLFVGACREVHHPRGVA